MYCAHLDIKICIGCGICINKCPTEAIPCSLLGFISSLVKINESKCTGYECGICIEQCPYGAIYMQKIKEKSVKV